jgi:hypothetical protein
MAIFVNGVEETGFLRRIEKIIDASAGGTDVEVIVGVIPAHSIFWQMGVEVIESFDGDTTQDLHIDTVVTFGGGTVISSSDFETADNNIDAGNVVAYTDANQPLPAGDTITVVWTNTGSASTGKAIVWVTYHTLNI